MSPASAPPSQPGQALEEENSTTFRRTQGGSIVGSLSFPQMGPISSKSKSNEQQNNSSKQQNNSSDFNFKISRHSSHFSHNRTGTSGNSPNFDTFQNASPGENNRNRNLAPHNGQGKTPELNSSSEDQQISL